MLATCQRFSNTPTETAENFSAVGPLPLTVAGFFVSVGDSGGSVVFLKKTLQLRLGALVI